MRMIIPSRLEVNTAYKAGWLWLPKSKVHLKPLKNTLRITAKTTRGWPKHYELWKETETHIGVPRELVDPSSLECELIDLTPKFRKVPIISKVILDSPKPHQTVQRDAYADLKDASGGILNLACGAGKTVIMLHAAANWGEPILVINNRGTTLDQWEKAANDFLVLNDKIGRIKGKPTTWDWRRPLTLASLKSLAMYHDQMPIGMPQWFGTIIWDETHHLSAPEFSKTAPIFPGRRYGATATTDRSDGTENIYFYHVGPVVHSNLDQDIIPKVWFVHSPIDTNIDEYNVRIEICDKNGELHIRKLQAYIGTRERELRYIKHHLDNAIANGRNILALSSSLGQIEALQHVYPEAGIITGSVKDDKDRKAALKKQLTIAINVLGEEALDEQDLDTLFILTEGTSDIFLQQSVGRIQRMKKGKKTPHLVVIAHNNIDPLRAMDWKMRRYYKKNNFQVEEIGKRG